MEGEDKNYYNKDFQMNVTLASQMQLINILHRMINLKFNYPIDSADKQKRYLDLVKLYLICATPYLSDNDVEKYQNELFNFNIKTKMIIKNRIQNVGYEFNQKLEKRLGEIMIELQKKLRKVFAKIKDDDDDDEGL